MNDLRVHDDGPIQLAAPDLERLTFQVKPVPPFRLDLTVCWVTGCCAECAAPKWSDAMSINLKRAYDAPATSDGYRILVDRIWPRGIVKGELQVDAWLKDLAPSAGLRKWFGHDPTKWDAFKERYARELEQHSDALEQLVARAKAGRVTLVFATKDTEHNNAVALKEQLDRRLMR